MNRITASDILKNWKDKEYITTEYTAADGSKCYRTYGDTAFYALLCERYDGNGKEIFITQPRATVLHSTMWSAT